MDSDRFVEELDRENLAHLARIDALREEQSVADVHAEMIKRLRLALRQEMEAAEIAARWMPDAQATDVKLALARMCGDEARHYVLLVERLRTLGDDVSALDPFSAGRTPFYDYLAALKSDVERVAAACFTREAVGHVRNEQFIAWCEAHGDAETARMYREQIQPDEWSHVESGRALLQRLAVDQVSQDAARAAAQHTLQMAEGAVTNIVFKLGMTCAPGC